MLLRAVPVCYMDRSRADHIQSRRACDTPPDLRLCVGRRTSRELQRTMQEGTEQFCDQKREQASCDASQAGIFAVSARGCTSLY